MANGLTIDQFGQEIKKKYPQYQGMSDAEVGNAVLQKYPQYQSRISSTPVQAPTQEKPKNNFLSQIFKPVGRAIATGAAAIEGGVDLAKGDVKGAQEALTRERKTGFGIYRPIGLTDTGAEKSLGGQVKDIVGTGAGVASFLTPSAIGGTGVKALSRAGAIAGGLGTGGEALQQDKSLGQAALSGLGGAALGGAVGAAIPLAGKAVGAIAKPIVSGAKRVVSPVAGVTKRIGQAIPERVSNISQNIAESGREATRRAELSPVVRKAVSIGIPEDTVTKLQQATPDDISFIKKMVSSASKKESPKKVLGQSALQRFGHVRKSAQNIGKKMDKEVDKMTLRLSNVQNPRQELQQVLFDNGIELNAKGKIVGTGSFTTSEANLLQKLINELPKGKLLSPRQIVLARRKIAATIREASATQGISPDSVQRVASQMDGVLTGKLSNEYRELSRQYAILKSSMDEFLKLLGVTKKGNIFYSLDDIVEKGDLLAGERLMRLLGNASAQSTEAVNMLDDVAKQFGYKGKDNIRTLAELSDLIESIYDVVPQRGFKGGIEGAMADIPTSFTGIALQTLKQAAGSSRANQRRAFEELLQTLVK